MASEGTSGRNAWAQARHKEATAMIAAPDEKCQKGAFSAERIVGKRYLVASHSGTKGRGRKLRRYVPQQNVLKRIVGQIALAVQREGQLYAKRAFRTACEVKGFESSWFRRKGTVVVISSEFLAERKLL